MADQKSRNPHRHLYHGHCLSRAAVLRDLVSGVIARSLLRLELIFEPRGRPGAAQLVDTQRGSWIRKYWPNTVGTKVLVGGKNVGIQRRSKAEPTARGKLYRVSTTFLRPLKCDLRRFLARRHIIVSLALALLRNVPVAVEIGEQASIASGR